MNYRYSSQHRAGFFMPTGCPLLAEIRSPGSVCERLLWRKQSLNFNDPAAISDPNHTLVAKQAIGIFILVGLRSGGV